MGRGSNDTETWALQMFDSYQEMGTEGRRSTPEIDDETGCDTTINALSYTCEFITRVEGMDPRYAEQKFRLRC